MIPTWGQQTFLGAIWVSSGGHLGVIWASLGGSSGGNFGVIWGSSGDHFGVICVSSSIFAKLLKYEPKGGKSTPLNKNFKVSCFETRFSMHSRKICQLCHCMGSRPGRMRATNKLNLESRSSWNSWTRKSWSVWTSWNFIDPVHPMVDDSLLLNHVVISYQIN